MNILKRRKLEGLVPGARAAITAVLALAALPGPVSAQAPSSRMDRVVWHWFGGCGGKDSLALEVRIDGNLQYTAVFPICRMRRADIRPEPQQRVFVFRFSAPPNRFGAQYPAGAAETIEANIWEAGTASNAIRLGVSFSTAQRVLLNTVHVAPAARSSRSERVRGIVIATHPLHPTQPRGQDP